MDPMTRKLLIGAGVLCAAGAGVLIFKKVASAKTSEGGTGAGGGAQIPGSTGSASTGSTGTGSTGSTGTGSTGSASTSQPQVGYTPPGTSTWTQLPADAVDATQQNYRAAAEAWRDAFLEPGKWFISNVLTPAGPVADAGMAAKREAMRALNKKFGAPTSDGKLGMKGKAVQKGGAWTFEPDSAYKKLDTFLSKCGAKPQTFTDASEEDKLGWIAHQDCPDLFYLEYKKAKLTPSAVLVGYILANLKGEAQLARSGSTYLGQTLVPAEFGTEDWWNWDEAKRKRYIENTCRKG